MPYKYTNKSGRKMYTPIQKVTMDSLEKKNKKKLIDLPDIAEFRQPSTPQQVINSLIFAMELLSDPESEHKTLASITRALKKPSNWFHQQLARNWINYFETPEEAQEFKRYLKATYDFLKDIVEQRIWKDGYDGKVNVHFIIYTLKTYFGRAETLNTVNLDGEIDDEGQVKPKIRGVDGNDLLVE